MGAHLRASLAAASMRSLVTLKGAHGASPTLSMLYLLPPCQKPVKLRFLPCHERLQVSSQAHLENNPRKHIHLLVKTWAEPIERPLGLEGLFDRKLGTKQNFKFMWSLRYKSSDCIQHVHLSESSR